MITWQYEALYYFIFMKTHFLTLYLFLNKCCMAAKKYIFYPLCISTPHDFRDSLFGHLSITTVQSQIRGHTSNVTTGYTLPLYLHRMYLDLQCPRDLLSNSLPNEAGLSK
jgi:integrase